MKRTDEMLLQAPITSKILVQIFGHDNFDLGCYYLAILIKERLNYLPNLYVYSSENNTGKTTFVKFLNVLFNFSKLEYGNNYFNKEIKGFDFAKDQFKLNRAWTKYRCVYMEGFPQKEQIENLIIQADKIDSDIIKNGFVHRVRPVAILTSNYPSLQKIKVNKCSEYFWPIFTTPIKQSGFIDYLQLGAEMYFVINYLKEYDTKMERIHWDDWCRKQWSLQLDELSK